jgi:hypothetical protein
MLKCIIKIRVFFGTVVCVEISSFLSFYLPHGWDALFCFLSAGQRYLMDVRTGYGR